MSNRNLELRELSLWTLLIEEDSDYRIPIYQRNYAWKWEEIFDLVQDIYDAFTQNANQFYYIGTLVTHSIGNKHFDVIDGQQRLTTIFILFRVLQISSIQSRLTYQAREKANLTMQHMPDWDTIEPDMDIRAGYNYAERAIKEVVKDDEKESFINYLLHNVHMIHYQVPQGTDMNHYFEVMNSRGEQLEQHEIVKAQLISQFTDPVHRQVFADVWNACSNMNTYIQRLFPHDENATIEELVPKLFPDSDNRFSANMNNKTNQENSFLTIEQLLESNGVVEKNKDVERQDTFLPIIDFPNFLLIVLKIDCLKKPQFMPDEFSLDDKQLLRYFKSHPIDAPTFICCLLKARYFLDNYIVHQSKDSNEELSNPWLLQQWYKGENEEKSYPKNVADSAALQNRLLHLLSMFEVAFTARQRKNYLLYILMYLINQNAVDPNQYAEFLEQLARCYFEKIYLNQSCLNSINVPTPGAFDAMMLADNQLNLQIPDSKSAVDFENIYGDGDEVSKGIPLFVFNYMDYCLWRYYSDQVSSRNTKKGDPIREAFFAALGCSDFSLDVFQNFYFSRTRRSLEHFYARALVDKNIKGCPTREQINCFGNYAMIGSEANSSGSSWSPITKLDHYLDSSSKIRQVSVASLKFVIMMQKCKDDQCWEAKQIREHQASMLRVLFHGYYSKKIPQSKVSHLFKYGRTFVDNQNRRDKKREK